MLQSVLVYTSVGLVLFYLGRHIQQREAKLMATTGETLPFYSWEIILSILIFGTVAGLRYHTGYDHASYLNTYLQLKDTGILSRQDFEPAFTLVSKLFAKFGLHFFFYFAFWAALEFSLLYYGLRKHKKLLPWIGLCLMLGPYFLHMMNTLRQGVVECLFVAMVPLIAKRKIGLYLLLTLFAMTLHKSSLILLPVYFIALSRIKIDAKWSIGIVALCFILGFFPQWIAFLLDKFGYALTYVGYGKYDHVYHNSNGFYFREITLGPITLLAALVKFSIVVAYPKVKAYFKEDKMLPFFFRLSYIYICYSFLMGKTTHYLLRPGEYFMPFLMIMAAYVLSYLWYSKKTKYFFAFLAVNCIYIFVELSKVFCFEGYKTMTVFYRFYFMYL